VGRRPGLILAGTINTGSMACEHAPIKSLGVNIRSAPDAFPNSDDETIMSDLLLFFAVGLTFGGGFVLMFGMFWADLGNRLRFFEVDLKPARGEKMFWIGSAMFALGLAFLLLFGGK
jgi:hypothetical protein